MAQTTASNDLAGLFGLKGRNYVITGGAQGIGLAVGKAIAQVGGNIVAMDIQDKPKPEFLELSSKFGVQAIYIQTDVTSETSLKAAFERAVDALGSIHGCVTCAGIAMEKPFEEHTWEEVRRVMDINVSRGLTSLSVSLDPLPRLPPCPASGRAVFKATSFERPLSDHGLQVLGTYFTSQLAVEQMKKKGQGGSLVLIASITAHTVLPHHRMSAYSASKGAVKMLSESLAVELAGYNIRSNTLSPGFIDTEMTQKARDADAVIKETMFSAPPLRRIGTPEDLVGAVLYLFSDLSTYTTGTDIAITGGLHIGRIDT